VVLGSVISNRGDNLKVVWAKFSTLSWAVLVGTAWEVRIIH
jgi:hypothetical protein